MVTDASWTDIDSDGDEDMVVVGDWMAITIFKNENGSFQNPIMIPNSNGWWNRIKAADLDGDGDLDLVSSDTTDDKTPQKENGTLLWFENDGKGNFTQRIIDRNESLR